MNRDDIIRLAQEAGGRIEHIGTNIAWFEFLPKNLERFAALVSAAEREACAKVCENEHKQRELYFEQTGNGMPTVGLLVSAAAIRARGEQ